MKRRKIIEGLKEYAVSWTPGNGSATVKSDTTGYEATGLTNGTEYTFSVAAVYDNGNPRAVLQKYNKDINQEIQRKRKEFKLDAEEGRS